MTRSGGKFKEAAEIKSIHPSIGMMSVAKASKYHVQGLKNRRYAKRTVFSASFYIGLKFHIFLSDQALY